MQTTNIEINPTRARNYVGVRCTQGDGKKGEALSGGVEETRKISVGRRCCRYSHVVYVADRSRLLEEPGRGKRSRTRSQRLGRSRERRQLGCQIYRSKKRAGKHSFLSFLIKKLPKKTTFLLARLKLKETSCSTALGASNPFVWYATISRPKIMRGSTSAVTIVGGALLLVLVWKAGKDAGRAGSSINAPRGGAVPAAGVEAAVEAAVFAQNKEYTKVGTNWQFYAVLLHTRLSSNIYLIHFCLFCCTGFGSSSTLASIKDALHFRTKR